LANNKTSPFPIEVHHLTRVEGHGNVVVDIWNGTIQQCDLEVVEAPRFFESMLRGRSYDQAPRLASRICGICAVAHSTASIKALESALGVEQSRQTALLRRLNYCGEMLDSHLLHVYMLVSPDLLGAGSIIPLVAEQPELVMRALRMKQAAGQICAAVGGRHTHPIAAVVGGFTHLPSVEELRELLRQLEMIAPDVESTVSLFSDLALPDFEREAHYLALQEEDGYGYIGGDIAGSDGGRWPVERYRDVVNEYQVSHSTAKQAQHGRRPYMVGALARFNLNFDHLYPAAKAAAARIGLAPVCHNPYLITAAQVVEIVHFYEEAIRIIGQLLGIGIQPEGPALPARLSGEGVGACEAPRGTLYHHYVVRNGAITEANCIIPTGQNLANIEADMRALAPQIRHRSKEEITLTLEMLVRAYDPCISCSTHMLEVRFV
jgi:coenzyme F420-reducing hydrogenase alpha subunit